MPKGNPKVGWRGWEGREGSGTGGPGSLPTSGAREVQHGVEHADEEDGLRDLVGDLDLWRKEMGGRG